MSRGTRAATWLTGLVATAVALRLAAGGELAAPPLGSPGGLADWVDEREPTTAAVALVRLVAEVGVWYVLGVSSLHAAASLVRSAGGHRLADALSVPAVARLARAGLGLGVVAASSLSPAASASGPASGGTAVMAPVATGTAVAAPTTGTATMRPVAPPEPPPSTMAAPAPATWVVEGGDSLWSIAEEVLGEALGRPATDAEVDPFWRELLERNRHRLVDPEDADLVHPGQVLELPPAP